MSANISKNLKSLPTQFIESASTLKKKKNLLKVLLLIFDSTPGPVKMQMKKTINGCIQRHTVSFHFNFKSNNSSQTLNKE